MPAVNRRLWAVSAQGYAHSKSNLSYGKLTSSNVSDPRALAIILEKAEENLRKNQHPDPYHREYITLLEELPAPSAVAVAMEREFSCSFRLFVQAELTTSSHVPRRHQVGAQHPSQDVHRGGGAPLGTPLDNVKSTDACVGRQPPAGRSVRR